MVPNLNPGLFDNTCTSTGADGSSVYTNASNAIFRTSRIVGNTTFANSGILTSDEPINTFDTLGQSLFTNLTHLASWTLFQSNFSFWGQNDGGQIFPHSAMKGPCLTGETCQVYDFALQNTDTILRNSTVSGNSQNTLPVAEQTCPNYLDGNHYVIDQRTPAQTYLINAREFVNDGQGDDDGLCESNERCIAMLNFGHDQNVLGTLGKCQFQNGVVLNVEMFFK